MTSANDVSAVLHFFKYDYHNAGKNCFPTCLAHKNFVLYYFKFNFTVHYESSL